MKFLLVIFIVCLATVATTHAQWIKQSVNTTASLRGLSVVNERTVWASGTGGTVIRTVDGGEKWDVIVVPGAEKLDFRDIEAFDANTAYILSIGNGESSRIYKTNDGGKNWNLEFKNTNEKAFFDAIACWDRNNCVAVSDPVDGKFLIIRGPGSSRTNQVGARASSWSPTIYPDKMPLAKDGEAAFAASGTCLITQGKNGAFLVTGGSAARVFRSTDRGLTWTVADTPIVHGTAGSGIFSIAMFDDKNGVIVGGNYEKPDDIDDTFATTTDGGVHWLSGSRLKGFRSGVVYADRQTIVAVGTSGSDVSYDRRTLWNQFGHENLNAIAAKGNSAIWTVGPNGGVYHLDSSFLSAKQPAFDPKKTDYPHTLDVVLLDLSHTEISSNCDMANKDCSNDPKVIVRATAAAFSSAHEFIYTVTGGHIIGEGSNVEWDLSGVKPGEYTITAGISIPAFISLPDTNWEGLFKTQTRSVLVR